MDIGPVKLTFFHYPFEIKFNMNFENIIAMPDLLTLAAMKAYALGRRPKWKDYVDLYFIMDKKHKLAEIIKKAKNIFGNEFNERKVIAEDFRTLEQKDILSAYFTFVAMDEENNPVEIIPVVPETSEQIKRFEAAEKRRQYRLKQNN